MAFTFRASSIYDSAGSSSATVAKPTGTVDGDIMFTIVSSLSGKSPSTIPSGWIRLAIYPTWDGIELFYKVASSEGESYVWGFPEKDNLRVTCASFYGDFNVLDPIDVVSNTVYNTSNTTIRAASMNVSKSNSPLLLFTYVYRTTSVTVTKPSVPTNDWVEDVDAGSGNSDIYHGIFHMVWSSSGATGNMGVTASETPTDKHAFAIAINPPVVAPTVTTQAVSSVGTTSATGNGNITATGGANATRRGFCYLQGNSGDPTTANSTAYDDGDFGTGAYTKSITGLTAGTSYRVRAYAINSAGTSYGSTVNLTTLAAGPTNLKSYNTNLKANIKTINTNPIANVKSLNTNV